MFRLAPCALFISLVATAITALDWPDLTDPSTFLVFLSYERPGFTCPACEHFAQILPELPIAVKTLNFTKNVRLGSRFIQYAFPAIIVRDSRRSYVLNPDNAEDLLKIISSESWRAAAPVKPYLDVNSVAAWFLSAVNPAIFFVISKLYFVMDRFPEKLVYVLSVAVIAYLIFSIVEVFREDTPKVKKD